MRIVELPISASFVSNWHVWVVWRLSTLWMAEYIHREQQSEEGKHVARLRNAPGVSSFEG